MHFEQMGVSLFIPGKDEPKAKAPGKELLAPGKITKYDMTRWIKQAGIDADTKVELLKLLARYPANTMHHFFKNIHEHIRRIHSEREETESEE